jgi:DNA-binding XRE family transcriptional regulator/predicted RNase H-like HicB family nuclease
VRYPAILTREGRYTLAHFPDAPGCQTQADPGEDIHAQASEALQGWLEATLAGGDVPSRVSQRAPRVKRGERVLWVDVPAKLALQLELRRARAAAGLTQAELAKRAGVSQPAIAKIENPDANPTIETLVKVAEALRVRLSIRLEAQEESAGSHADF